MKKIKIGDTVEVTVEGNKKIGKVTAIFPKSSLPYDIEYTDSACFTRKEFKKIKI